MRRLPGLVSLQSHGEGNAREIPCFQCGVCCVRWQPLLSPEEIRRLSQDFGITPRTFKRRYTRPYPLRRGWHQLKTGAAGCVFLAYQGSRALCTIHAVRPQVCRDWMPSLDKRECQEGLRSLNEQGVTRLEELYAIAEDRRRFTDVLGESQRRG